MGNCQKASAVQPVEPPTDKLPDYYDKWYHSGGEGTTRTNKISEHNSSYETRIKGLETGLAVTKILRNYVHNLAGETIDLKAHLHGKILGLYFSGHWSSACKAFTPILTKFYKMHSKTKKFEIIFISSDETLDEFKKSYAEMPWLALSFDQRQVKHELSERYNSHQGIPLLILINPETGEIINLDARLSLELDKEGALFPWKVDYAFQNKSSLLTPTKDLTSILKKNPRLDPMQDFYSSSHLTGK